MKNIATLRMKSNTPCSMAGTSSLKADTILRLTELRSVAQWWLRAIVGGKAYDYQKHSIKATKKAENKVFSLTSQSSLISYCVHNTNISDLNDSEIRRFSNELENNEYPRLRLILMGRGNKRGRLDELLKNISTTLTIHSLSKNDSIEEKIALYATLLPLLLQGLGKISRRGLGAFSVKLESEDPDIQINSSNFTIETAQQTLEDILEKFRATADDFINQNDIPSVSQQNSLLSFLMIAEDFFHYMLIKFANDASPPPLSIVQRIFTRGGSFRNRNWVNMLPTHVGLPEYKVNPRNHFYYLRNFILGLPRESEKFDTGYESKDSEYERRASPLIASFLKKTLSTITIFTSSDFPHTLEWRGTGTKRKATINIDQNIRLSGQKNPRGLGPEIPEDSLSELFETARKKLRSILEDMIEDGIILNKKERGI